MRVFLCFLSLWAMQLPAQATCWQEAGQRYGIEPELLHAIAIVESNLQSSARNQNRDGSYDIGLMQINSRHLPLLRNFQISESALLDDPCLSVMTGAWVLAGFMRRYGYSWEAVGAYNAGNGSDRGHLRQRYIQRVHPHYARLKKESRTAEQ
ncbi:soluble lytic murein transglycosylase-like protein [Erwinia toletana]|uniref:Soluble lytic murein transglycosylase-like protein n=1 Tax=Winslowiella toletana TaxID=92490 RepID=A0ABS4PCE0_9GAMM|nr:lytic transglycosylase domain-containing protein [Winslowiella toletana]MBP2169736.1 soluble lytic murein transglycosylase-like protein [Winslowiella toletana]